jgi:surface polysaccharide O-acyltransferase-like enzyme
MRISGIDTTRVAASFAVVCIHTHLFRDLQYPDTTYKTLSYIIDQACRFAVPFFFVTSGYFFGKKLVDGAEIRILLYRYCKRLAIVFLIWSAVYAVIPPYWLMETLKYGPLKPFYWQFNNTLNWISNNPLTFIMQGTSTHLWFLVALLIAFLILTFSISFGLQKYVIPFSALLYAIGLLGGAYSTFPIGIHLPIPARSGPFFGTLFVALGWWLSNRTKPKASVAYLIIIVGFALHMTEAIFLRQYIDESTRHDYLLGTIPYGVGVFMLALTHPRMGQSTFLPSLGKFTLGIYVSHPLIWWGIAALSLWIDGPSWEIIFPVLVYILTVYIVFLLTKFRLTQRLVT